jgi:hypothetical protein
VDTKAKSERTRRVDPRRDEGDKIDTEVTEVVGEGDTNKRVNIVV